MKSLLPEMTYRLFRGKSLKESKPVFGSILGIAMSMIPLIVVLFLSDGMIKGITDRYIETGSFHMQIKPYERFTDTEWEKTLLTLQSKQDIKAIYREHSGMGLAYSDTRQYAVKLRAIQTELYEQDSGFQKFIDMREGEFQLSAPTDIIIGKETAKSLNASVGDEIKIMTGKTLSNGKYIPKVSRFTVQGIFTTGYQDLDKLWVFVSLEKGLKILQDQESRSHIAIKVEDPYSDLTPLIRVVKTSIEGRWGIYTWLTLNRSQQSNYASTKVLLMLIMALIVLVAVMNISSSMIMLVMENEQEIGILKSMGMKNGFLSLQYVLTAGMAGAAGSGIGIVAGSALALNINAIVSGLERMINILVTAYRFLFRIPMHSEISLLSSDYYLESFNIILDYKILGIIFILTSLLSMLGALIPIRRIGKITPLDILRKH